MIIAKSTAKPMIGPLQHGRKMSLKAFEFAEARPGYLWNWQGVLVVSEMPNFPHALATSSLSRNLDISTLPIPASFIDPGSMECKVLVPDWESERHPDIAVYLSPPKGKKDRTMWRPGCRNWSSRWCRKARPRSRLHREARRVLDARRQGILDRRCEAEASPRGLRRGRTQWTEKTLGPTDQFETKLLPGFKLACKAVFEVAGE